MMQFSRAALVAVACLAPRLLWCQDSLRVLRVQPASPASPLDPVVVTFDHPVAPRLDRSVNPDNVLDISPRLPHRAYWRDPSTIVVAFDTVWKPGSIYRVSVNPGLRSESGARLATTKPTQVEVRNARVMFVNGAKGSADADTIARPVAVFDNSVELGELAAKVWFKPRANCARSDSLGLRALSIERLTENEGRYDGRSSEERARWPDSLRRRVTFEIPAVLPRGCTGEVRMPAIVGKPELHASQISVIPPLRVDAIECAQRDCLPGQIRVSFSLPVSQDEVASHITVNGRRAVIASGGRNTWTLGDSVVPRQTVHVTVSGALRDIRGDVLGRDVNVALTGKPLPPSVGYTTGQVLVPKSATVLLRLRYVNTDSVFVAIARVPDSLRAIAAAQTTNEGIRPTAIWRGLRDSVFATIGVASTPDVDGFLDVPITMLPASWRDDPVLLVRAATPDAERKHIREAIPWEDRARRLPNQPPVGLVPRVAVVNRTDLAIHALRTPTAVNVWVTDVRGGEPRRGVTVRVLDDSLRYLDSAITDVRGRAAVRFAGAHQLHDPLLVDAAVPGDRAMLFTMLEDYGSDYGFNDDIWNPAPVRIGNSVVRASTFAERGIYRPGEKVFLGSVIRLANAFGELKEFTDSLRWTVRYLRYAQREEIWAHSGVADAMGVYNDSMDLPRSTRVGDYVASLFIKHGGKWQALSVTHFSVAEYRAPEFSVSIDSVHATVFAGNTASVSVRGKYLFGQPMAAGTVEWHANERPSYAWEQRLRGLAGWTVGYDEPDSTRDIALEGTGVLDANGVLVIPIQTAQASRPRVLALSAVVSDANRQVVMANTEVDVHSANTYVGIRARRGRQVLMSHDSVTLEFTLAHADGSARTGDSLTLELLRDQWVNGRRTSESLARWRRLIAGTTDTLTLRHLAPGSYRLVAIAHDEMQRGARTDYPLWVAGPSVLWAQRDARTLDVRADTSAYRAGDSATVFIESPAAQRAWIIVRRAHVLHDRMVELARGVTAVKIALPEDLAPAAEIRVIAVEPYGSSGNDTAGVYLRTGVATVTVTAPDRSLKLAIVPDRRAYAPGDSAHISVQLRNAAGAGERATVTLWAVDQGVTALTDYRLPNLLPALNWTDGRAAQSSTLLARLLLAPPAVRESFVTSYIYGGSGSVSLRLRGASSMRMQSLSEIVTTNSPAVELAARTVFRTTAFFTIGTTDSSGRAIFHVALPHNVTTYRVYAEAAGAGDHVAGGDTSLVTTLPFIVRAALPRIVRASDSLYAGAVLTQQAQDTTHARLTVSASNIDIVGDSSVSGTLAGRQARELRVPMKVREADSVTVRFSGVTLGATALRDAVAVSLPVSPPGRARAWVTSGIVRDSATVALPLPGGTDATRSHVSVQLGTSLLPTVDALVNALRIYPYDCTEQIASAGQAILARHRLAIASGDTSALGTQDRELLERGVGLLVKRQRSDGGFGYWSAEGWTSPWLTAHALQFLLQVSRAGISVPEGVRAEATRFLTAALAPTKRPASTTDRFDALRDSLAFGHDAASVALMLRRAGAADTVLERDLLKVEHLLGLEDRLLVAHLLIERGDTTRAGVIVDAAWRTTHVEGKRVTLPDSAASRSWLFRSIVRPYALLLSATANVRPAHPLLGALLESVMQVHQSSDSWWNTLDQALAVNALAVAGGAMEVSAPREITLANARGTVTRRALSPARTDSLLYRIADLRGQRDSTLRLKLTSRDAKPTVYAMTLFEVPSSKPVRADEAGIAVERWYESYRDGKPVTEVRAGELVRVRLRITVPTDREFIVIDDALPAGLEAVDLSLRTSSSLPPFEGAPRLQAGLHEGPPGQRWLYGSWDGGWWTPWEHKEIRDDRVLYFARQLWKGSYQASYVARATTVGNFVRPPAQAEEMYNPAVRGRSDGGRFVVLPE